ncbi:hypothetical protein C8035_v004588 [Colletotrichum spinosum]|uniref:GED domain-containing protein n=1 Tax=Colletotrichum spinosum TaxID=1347390 RepID=A0A4R8PXS6_9PEZI|nr:hypothetical protein C8035_v004588 [Colletotrichum spinosum]
MCFLHLEKDVSNLQNIFGEANKYFCRYLSKATAIQEALCVRFQRQDLPRLIISDFPGLAPSFHQKVDVPDPTEDPVGSCLFREMCHKHNLIICVVGAAKGPVSKRPFKLAQLADPDGRRTIGVVAAPFPSLYTADIQHGLTSAELASLQDDWCLVRYPPTSSLVSEHVGDDSSCTADRLGSGFQSASNLTSLVTSFFDRLSQSVPRYLTKMKDGLKDSQDRLEHLTCHEKTMEERRLYMSTTWRELCACFASIDSGAQLRRADDWCFLSGNNNRACVAIQKQPDDVDAKLSFDSPWPKETKQDRKFDKGRLPKEVSRSFFNNHVRRFVEKNRGQILPGLVDPLLVSQLFVEKSEPWKDVVCNGGEEICESLLEKFDAAVVALTDKESSDNLKPVFKTQLTPILEDFRGKIDEIVQSYRVAHPVPYNSILVEKVQQVQNSRRTTTLTRNLLNDVIRVDSEYKPSSFRQPSTTVPSLAQSLVSGLDGDAVHLTYETLTDYVEGYYDVALQGLLESIRMQAVGGCLIQKLADVFDPSKTGWITDDIISQVEFESEETKAEKRLLDCKIHVLGKGVKIIDVYLALPPADCSGQSSSSSEPVETPDETPVETPDETPVVDLSGVVTEN